MNNLEKKESKIEYHQLSLPLIINTFPVRFHCWNFSDGYAWIIHRVIKILILYCQRLAFELDIFYQELYKSTT